jgi:DNA-binding protein YbaB
MRNMTAVEWYNLKVIELMTQREQGNIDVLEFRNQLDLLLEQAKEMFEDQIMEAFNDGVNDECIGGNKTPEQYYNETFKSE